MEHPAYYSIIPATVRYDSNLTANAKLLYGEITALANKEGYCWASNRYFAELYGVSKDSIQRYIKQLKDFGYVRVEIIKEDNEVKERRIYVCDDPSAKMPLPGGKIDPTPGGKIDPLNNTSSNTTSNKDIVGKVISYLNVKTAQGYRATSKATERLINARIREGYALEDFYAVIDDRNAAWGNDPERRIYLRPETLFKASKFENYLQHSKSLKPKRLEYDEEGWL